MRLFVAGLLLLGLAADANAADVREFPYEAVVEAGTVFVHSGPGRKYYATSRLSRGERVRVHRHDPGGWYMISPPPGSFSWIRADAVERAGQRRGVLIDNNVVVRVGSALEDSRDVFQSRLSTGARVEILGEQVIRTGRGPVRMLKIVPPQGEWRWVPGQAVTPVEQTVRHQHDRDPYRVPSHARRDDDDAGRIHDRAQRDDDDEYRRSIPAPHPDEQDGPSLKRRSRDYDGQPPRKDFIERPIIRSFDRDTRDATRFRGPTNEQIHRDRDRLRDLDDTFRAMIKHEPYEWDFRELRLEYLDLQETASYSALASQVDMRLASLDRYEDIRRNYSGFLRLTAKVNRRDARLAALQEEQLYAHESGNFAEPVSHSEEHHPHEIVYSQPQGAAPAPSGPHQVITPIPEGSSLTYVQPGPGIPGHPGHGHPVHGHPVNGHPVQVQPGQPGGFQPPIPATSVSTPGGTFTTHVPAVTQSSGLPRLKGAGIIQRAIGNNPHAPRHVLLAPNGKILAYLQPSSPGMNLDQYVGQQMGIDGGRLRRPDLRTDVFVVQNLHPVQLR